MCRSSTINRLRAVRKRGRRGYPARRRRAGRYNALMRRNHFSFTIAALTLAFCVASCFSVAGFAQSGLPATSAEDRACSSRNFQAADRRLVTTTDTPQGQCGPLVVYYGDAESAFSMRGFAPEDRAAAGAGRTQDEPCGAHQSRGNADGEAGGVSLPHRRGAGAAFGLDNRSVSVCQE